MAPSPQAVSSGAFRVWLEARVAVGGTGDEVDRELRAMDTLATSFLHSVRKATLNSGWGRPMRLHWIAIAATSVLLALTIFFVFRPPNHNQMAQPSYQGLSSEKCKEQRPETGMMPEYSCEKP
jgi:hypothetical protein